MTKSACPSMMGEPETKQKGVYVAGVVCGGMDTSSLFIENSRIHAEQIAKHVEKNL
ncbi:MAG: hypothetical protein U5K71_03465 [Gracilimonas sp.]|nr:hypothetical protein [Gracilimonas sp.]